MPPPRNRILKTTRLVVKTFTLRPNKRWYSVPTLSSHVIGRKYYTHYTTQLITIFKVKYIVRLSTNRQYNSLRSTEQWTLSEWLWHGLNEKSRLDVQNNIICSCTNTKCVLYVFVLHVNQYFFLITGSVYRYLTTKSQR